MSNEVPQSELLQFLQRVNDETSPRPAAPPKKPMFEKKYGYTPEKISGLIILAKDEGFLASGVGAVMDLTITSAGIEYLHSHSF